jgi:hypothetical protein
VIGIVAGVGAALFGGRGPLKKFFGKISKKLGLDRLAKKLGLDKAASWLKGRLRLPRGSKHHFPDFDDFSKGQGFSGVFDPQTGTIRIKPSTASPDLPPGWVPRRGGHGRLKSELVEEGLDVSQLQGFTAFLDEAGQLRLEFMSRSVNGANRAFRGSILPPNMRAPLVDKLNEVLGRKVY